MKNNIITTVLLMGVILISCSKDDSNTDPSTTIPAKQQPLPINVKSISSEMLYTGEILSITGTNFTNKDFPTKIFINNIEVSPKSISDTEIQLVITDDIKKESNSLTIQIDNIMSKTVRFFVMGKGWNKLTTFESIDIITSSIFDNSKTIFSFVDNDDSKNGFWGAAKKMEAKSDGYKYVPIRQQGSFGQFKMYDDKNGVLTSTIEGQFTDNCFETHNKLPIEFKNAPEINGLRIGYLDATSCILTTIIGAQVYTADKGITIIKNDCPKWSRKSTSFRANIKGFGKSSSDSKYYQLGFLYDWKMYGSGIYKNIVLESETGYSNWIVKDTLSNSSYETTGSDYKFLNINKIFSVNTTSKILYVSTDMMKTWSVLKTDVSSIFIRTENQWYIQSGNGLYVTNDAGKTWALELELPTESVINDISFSKTKIIVSGNKGLHYLKIE